jgi:hypothetical protein
MTSFPVKVRVEGLKFDVPHLRLLPVRGSDHQLDRAVYLQSKDATISELTIRSFLPKKVVQHGIHQRRSWPPSQHEWRLTRVRWGTTAGNSRLLNLRGRDKIDADSLYHLMWRRIVYGNTACRLCM